MTKHDIHAVRFQHPAGEGALAQVVRLSELRARQIPDFYRPQRRDFHVIHVVTEGAGRHHLEFEPVDLGRGSLLYVAKGQVDWYDEASDHDAFLLIFRPEAIQRAHLAPSLVSSPLRPNGPEFQRLVELVTLIDQFQRLPHLRSATLHLLEGFVDALGVLRSQATSALHPASRNEHCERFETLIENHCHEERSVTWYAERANVSAKTLTRASESVFGCSAKQHIDESVVLRAKRLLVHTSATVDEVAHRMGFSEPTNFVKFFRRLESCTPNAFRERFDVQDLV
ncbi:MAG: helix-turn-helix transcriptional regulator [Planctomycetota bacterium]